MTSEFNEENNIIQLSAETEHLDTSVSINWVSRFNLSPVVLIVFNSKCYYEHEVRDTFRCFVQELVYGEVAAGELFEADGGANANRL